MMSLYGTCKLMRNLPTPITSITYFLLLMPPPPPLLLSLPA